MSKELETQIRGLERRITRLERREAILLSILSGAISDKDAFVRFALECDLEPEQRQGIENALETAHDSLLAGKPPSAIELEHQLLPYIPRAELTNSSVYAFVQRLMVSLACCGLWPQLIEHFRSDFNIPPAERLRKNC